MGKVTVLPVGGCARWKIPSLEQVETPTLAPQLMFAATLDTHTSVQKTSPITDLNVLGKKE
jgi:hypothetical protein